MEVEENNHAVLLEKLCRLCGKKVQLKKGYVNAKLCSDYSSTLRSFFGILPSEDLKTYPQKLCISCKHRLDKINKTGKDNLNSSPLFEYNPHTPMNCWLCTTIKFQSATDVNANIKEFDKYFNMSGFTKALVGEIRSYSIIEASEWGPKIKFSVTIKHDFTWSMHALNQEIKDIVHLQLPETLNNNNIQAFCEQLQTLSVCSGRKDFQDVLKERVQFKQPFPSTDLLNPYFAFVEAERGETKLIKGNFSIVRSSVCKIITTEGEICLNCTQMNKKLSIYKKRVSTDKEIPDSDPSSNTNIRYLKHDVLEERYKKLQESKQAALRKLAQTSESLRKIMAKESVNGSHLSSSHHEVFKEILKNKTPNFDEESPQWLLWQQQAEMAKKTDKRGMRWHPLIIRWCLSIYMTSPAAYRQIASKQNKFMVLPHVNTLKKYINFTSPNTGFAPDIIDKIVSESHLDTLEDYQKNLSLTFDEIRIKSGIIYKKGSGKIIGFTDMGALNDEIKVFVDQCTREASGAVDDGLLKPSDFANYVMVFMVRGIFTGFCSTIGYFASSGMTGDQLCPLVLEATRILEAITFKVRNWTCDGATPNRKMFQIASIGEGLNWCTNPYNNSRKVFFISDPPHLMKTLRNNLENSHGNINSRNLMRNGKSLSWMHIVDLYDWDLGMNRAALGLRMLHKLKDEHIKLTPQHRMSVKYAVQVLSNSVAAALKMQADQSTSETIRFIEMFDKAFDCLNVTRVKRNDKPYRQPFRDINDQRFDFLMSVVHYLEDWEREVEAIPLLRKEEQNRLIISHQTVLGWKLTILSFVELVKLLLAEAGDGKFILSEKFSQDPLEEHFSRHRRFAGCNDNPTLAQFEQQEVALHVLRGELVADLRGNTAGRQMNRRPVDINDTRLPKKRSR